MGSNSHGSKVVSGSTRATTLASERFSVSMLEPPKSFRAALVTLYHCSGDVIPITSVKWHKYIQKCRDHHSTNEEHERKINTTSKK